MQNFTPNRQMVLKLRPFEVAKKGYIFRFLAQNSKLTIWAYLIGFSYIKLKK
jgi:hypothetical protein